MHLTLLTIHRDAMVDHLVERIGIEPGRAAAMIDQLETRLTRRIVKDYTHLSIDDTLARRILNDALGFLSFAADYPGYGPAPMPDLGWHTFMNYSPEYSAFCDAIAGRYLHHFPNDVKGLSRPPVGAMFPNTNEAAGGAAECSCGSDDGVLNSDADASFSAGSRAAIRDSPAVTVIAMQRACVDLDIDLWVGESARRFALAAG
jgi:hypothetical protein